MSLLTATIMPARIIIQQVTFIHVCMKSEITVTNGIMAIDINKKAA